MEWKQPGSGGNGAAKLVNCRLASVRAARPQDAPAFGACVPCLGRRLAGELPRGESPAVHFSRWHQLFPKTKTPEGVPRVFFVWGLFIVKPAGESASLRGTLQARRLACGLKTCSRIPERPLVLVE